MPSTNSLLVQLKQEYPAFRFVESDHFKWIPAEQTIYSKKNSADYASLLHEVAHGVLKHQDYIHDIELLQIEREAWEYASKTLAVRYGISIDQEEVENMLDTYRDWLHDRSLCPTCQATGIQSSEKQYTCLACGGIWRVNEAKNCALRRYTK